MNLDNLFREISKRGLSLKKISDETGISAGLLSEWKNGNHNPSLNTIERLADYLDCSVDYLIGRTDIPNMKSLYELSRLYDVRIKLKSIEDDISAILLQK